jgi:hypothetical protein
MKLFKKEIIIAIKIYIKEFSEQNFPDINKEEFFNLYLSKYSKNKKKTTAYMMFVKEMHKEYEKKEQIDKIKFSEKAKLIGNKWCNLPDVEKEKYGFIADNNNMVEHDTDNDNICTWVNEKNNKKCFKDIYDNEYNLCKKHFKLFSKRKSFLERNKEKQNQIKFDDYTNSEVQEILYNNSTIYYDIYKRIYSLDEQNNALCIGEIIDDNIILFDIKKESHNESHDKSHNESHDKSYEKN